MKILLAGTILKNTLFLLSLNQDTVIKSSACRKKLQLCKSNSSESAMHMLVSTNGCVTLVFNLNEQAYLNISKVYAINYTSSTKSEYLNHSTVTRAHYLQQKIQGAYLQPLINVTLADIHTHVSCAAAGSSFPAACLRLKRV